MLTMCFTYTAPNVHVLSFLKTCKLMQQMHTGNRRKYVSSLQAIAGRLGIHGPSLASHFFLLIVTSIQKTQ